jgi:2,3-bisphosphoglycerate-independent phosphoglycerate mutase
MQRRRPVMLVVLDGWGWREDPVDNAVRQAHTPNFDRLWRTCPHALLQASGKDVGLPPGQMGNSEVGHLNIGAGRVVMQDLQRINDAMADGWLKSAPALVNLIACLRRTGGTCHLLGLASPAACIPIRTTRLRWRRFSRKPAYPQSCMFLPMVETRRRAPLRMT